jgi:hypothetical protein
MQVFKWGVLLGTFFLNNSTDFSTKVKFTQCKTWVTGTCPLQGARQSSGINAAPCMHPAVIGPFCCPSNSPNPQSPSPKIDRVYLSAWSACLFYPCTGWRQRVHFTVASSPCPGVLGNWNHLGRYLHLVTRTRAQEELTSVRRRMEDGEW